MGLQDRASSTKCFPFLTAFQVSTIIPWLTWFNLLKHWTMLAACFCHTFNKLLALRFEGGLLGLVERLSQAWIYLHSISNHAVNLCTKVLTLGIVSSWRKVVYGTYFFTTGILEDKVNTFLHELDQTIPPQHSTLEEPSTNEQPRIEATRPLPRAASLSTSLEASVLFHFYIRQYSRGLYVLYEFSLTSVIW